MTSELVRLIYASRVVTGAGRNVLQHILDKAVQHNPQHGISGVLYFNQRYFLQCLEGGRREVNRLYQRITKDSRHTDVELIAYGSVVAREFGDWGMGYLPAVQLTAPVLLAYSPISEFDPYHLGAESALGLLVTLRDVCLRDSVDLPPAHSHNPAQANTHLMTT